MSVVHVRSTPADEQTWTEYDLCQPEDEYDPSRFDAWSAAAEAVCMWTCCALIVAGGVRLLLLLAGR